MNKGQKTAFERHAKALIPTLRNLIKSGEGRGLEAKEGNYREIVDLLHELHCNTTETDVQEGAEILKAVLGRTVEVHKPPADNGAAKKLATMLADSSGVSFSIAGVTVQLDCDQNKHQHPSVPIGTRMKGGGNRFVATCDAAWHHANTMTHMATWANQLGGMTAGQQQFHGQMVAVGGIHYEGFCLLANGQKYVSFHCYPADDSPLLL